jgi:hypothetical protein
MAVTRAAAARVALAPPTPVKFEPDRSPRPETESIDDILGSIQGSEPAPRITTTATVMSDEDFTSLFEDLTAPAPAPAPASAPARAPARAPAPASAPAASAPRVTMMKAVIDSVCFSCGQKIPAQAMAAFIPGKGLRHPGCP